MDMQGLLQNVLSGECSIAKTIDELTGPSTKTELGMLLDDLLQQINVHELLDPYAGSEFTEDGKLTLYFSDAATEAEITDFVGSLNGGDFKAVLESQPGQTLLWKIVVLSQKAAEPEVTGNMGVEVPMAGDLSIPINGED